MNETELGQMSDPSRGAHPMSSYDTSALQRWRARTDRPLLVLAVATVPLLLAELLADGLSSHDEKVLFIVNAVLAAAFVTDLVVELVACRRHWRSYLRHEWLTALIALSQVIAMVPALAGLGVFRAARAARPIAAGVRILALASSASRGRAVLRRHAASAALWAAAMTWLTAAMSFIILEDKDGARDVSLADGLWWSLSTITTVGYGDIYPVTPGGRLVAGVTMLVGISTFAVVTARVAAFLSRSREGAEEQSATVERV